MKATTFRFKAADGAEIFTRKWEEEPSLRQEQTKAVVQLAHGMAEHSGRYDEFARFLVKNGYIVYTNDHRGHGSTAKSEAELGFFAEENGFAMVVNDLSLLTERIKQENPGVPVFLFGHSMGSFLARRYVQLHGEAISGLLLSGTGGNPGVLGKIATLFAAKEIRKQGKKGPSQKMDRLLFRTYNRGFSPCRTSFDWLSSDEKEVDKYVADPLCGRVMTAGFYYDLLHGLQRIHQKTEERKVPKSLPVYIFSGDKDPVGSNAKGVMHVYRNYVKHGLTDIEYKLYPGGRHEMLNEANKQEVYEDCLRWLDRHV
ncbi:Lysophospholipase, alpha-beta hydrolase superfamily [Evansella caseinilytica]|uniref:Lysophospholipase, alpha-beta hydrolase superfamily n=1 Tax=Evansella caseinilytica TaxID=1503961 RepID=A0A1H3UPR7_9BACI|nr:alpha/beta hydrolase [Evansella caseinilytica]SDZ64337.1 Lysophospholipase, alpha-beta hydrolase superfamily [Evansella caseinilytica]